MDKLQPAFSREQLTLPRAGGGAEVVVTDSSRVLRNTYWLLALSMLPTTLESICTAPGWMNFEN